MNAPNRKPPPRMTVTDFLAWNGPGKWELVDGELRAMAPASATHGMIQANLAKVIGRHLDDRKGPCRVITEPAIAVRLRASLNTRIPDLGITCSPVGPTDVLLPEPVALIEILSPGNPDDTWSNVWTYSTIPSVREIIVLHSTRVLAEVLRRDSDGNWPMDPEDVGPDSELRLETVGLALLLREAYVGTYLLSEASKA
ncbi:MAG: Uma2 family endonuclease [Hyphomicrobiaceae bacterium]|nr:Uma2 family endonuclease [Hyphomicrobiaceae bacterium]